MAEREYPVNTMEADVERSSEDIRQDIAKGEENISQTVAQISERIKEKLDWREYVKESPYWAIGAVAFIGYLASGMFVKRPTQMEQIMDSVAENVRDTLRGMLAGAVGPVTPKVTLGSIVTAAAAAWITKAISPPDAASDIDEPQT